MGQTRVDLLHLLEDLRDAYPGGLEETILTEIVANALDSGAARISVRTDRAEALLVVVDDGAGMRRRELARYHDVAASAKVRGQGIGFAGVGIKLGLLASEEVLTETRRPEGHVATRWRLASRHRAPWRWVDPPGLVENRGTAVCLKLRNALSPLLDAAWLEASLRRHYAPLFDPGFDELLSAQYPRPLEFRVDGHPLARERRGRSEEAAWITVRLSRQRRPAAVGYLRRAAEPLAEDDRGLAVSTLGKVIRRGWDWLGLAPAAPEFVGGLLDAPGLAASLTLNKGDFIRQGSRGIAYLAYRKAIQEAVAGQLAAWGEGREVEDSARRRAARPVERDLETVLLDLAEDFPAVAALVDRRPGGQRRLPAARLAHEGESPLFAAAAPVGPSATAVEGAAATGREGAEGGEAAGEAAPSSEATLDPSVPARGPRSQTRYGLRIQFEENAESDELGRLVESTVWVNAAHPAYRRAVASRAEAYHAALTVAMTLAPLAAEAAHAQRFVTAFLAAWGDALSRDKRRRQDRRGRLRRRRRDAG
jgi:Histidine kinase-, DNA gyrase B-, and HSP90-like ATPase